MCNQDKLNLLLKKNLIIKNQNRLLEELHKNAKINISSRDFINFNEGELLWSKFIEKLKNGIDQKNVSKDSMQIIIQKFKSMQLFDSNSPVIIFSNSNFNFGAINLKAGEVFPKLDLIWSVIRNDLSLATPDLENGLCLEFNFYTLSGEFKKDGIFELSAWGNFRKYLDLLK